MLFDFKRSDCTDGAGQFKIVNISIALVLFLRVSRVGEFALVSNSM